MRRNGVPPKVISGILGHAKVNIGMDTYDRATVDDLEQPMADVVKQLLASVTQTGLSRESGLENEGLGSTEEIESA